MVPIVHKYFYIPNDSLKIRNAYSQNVCVTFLYISIAQTEDELKRVNQEKYRVEKEKDEKIKELEIKINSMGLAYENVLNVSLLNFTIVTQPFLRNNKIQNQRNIIFKKRTK